MATLERRGLDAPEVERLARFMAVAQNVEVSTNDTSGDDSRVAEFVALYAWYREWTETARRVVTRKDHRILFGIASKGDAKTPHANAV